MSLPQACVEKRERWMHSSLLHGNVGFQRGLCVVMSGVPALGRVCFGSCRARPQPPCFVADYYEHAEVGMQYASRQVMHPLLDGGWQRCKLPDVVKCQRFVPLCTRSSAAGLLVRMQLRAGRHARLSVCHRPTHSSFPSQTHARRLPSILVRTLADATSLSVQCTTSQKYKYTVPGNPEAVTTGARQGHALRHGGRRGGPDQLQSMLRR